MKQNSQLVENPRFLLQNVLIDENMYSSSVLSSVEEQLCDEVASNRFEVNPNTEHCMLDNLMGQQDLGMFKASIGSCNSDVQPYLIPDDEYFETSPTDNSDNHDDVSMETLARYLLESTEGDDNILDDVFASATTASQLSKGVSAKHLSKVWRIDLPTAEKTIEITSQRVAHNEVSRLRRNYGTTDRMVRYKRINTHFFVDTFFATSKGGRSSRGHTCCQLFVTDKGLVHAIPMTSKKEVIQAVKQFAKDIGAPDAIISDGAGEQLSEELRRFLQAIGTLLRVLEEGTPWSNRAKLYIGIIKEAVQKDMKDSNSPLPFWDYCVERRVRISNLTAKKRCNQNDTNAHTLLTGEEGDISNQCTFNWYEWCYYMEHTNKFRFNQEVLGRVLGPAKGSGNKMAQWILKSNSNVVPR